MPFKGVILSGNLFDLLSSVRAVGDDLTFHGSPRLADAPDGRTQDQRKVGSNSLSLPLYPCATIPLNDVQEDLMISVPIPGWGELSIEYLMVDFNGTAALDGKLKKEVKDVVEKISRYVKVFIITADSYDSVDSELGASSVTFIKVNKHASGDEKAKVVRELGPEKVVAIGNGSNDALMFKESALGHRRRGRRRLFGCPHKRGGPRGERYYEGFWADHASRAAGGDFTRLTVEGLAEAKASGRHAGPADPRGGPFTGDADVLLPYPLISLMILRHISAQKWVSGKKRRIFVPVAITALALAASALGHAMPMTGMFIFFASPMTLAPASAR